MSGLCPVCPLPAHHHGPHDHSNAGRSATPPAPAGLPTPYTREELDALPPCSTCDGEGWLHDGMQVTNLDVKPGEQVGMMRRVPCWACRLRATARAGLDAQQALRECDIGGVFDEFRDVPDAIRQMAQHIRELAEQLRRPKADAKGANICDNVERCIRTVRATEAARPPALGEDVTDEVKSVFLAGFKAGANGFDRQRTHSTEGEEACDTCIEYRQQGEIAFALWPDKPAVTMRSGQVHDSAGGEWGAALSDLMARTTALEWKATDGMNDPNSATYSHAEILNLCSAVHRFLRAERSEASAPPVPPSPAPAPTCDAEYIDGRESFFCILPEGHEGPHETLCRQCFGKGREERWNVPNTLKSGKQLSGQHKESEADRG